MSSRELNDWMAYAAVEPFGDEQADRRIAVLAHTVAAAAAGKKAPSFDTYMKALRPEWTPPPKAEQSIDELREAFAMRARRAKPSAPKRDNS